MALSEALGRRLRAAIAEKDTVQEAAATARYAVDGLAPGAVLYPSSEPEIAAVLLAAAGTGAAVVPWGGGTRMGRGHVLTRYELALSTARLDRIVDHDVPNLTVSVQAGLTLASLQAELARFNQYLPIEPPLPERATVGGITASNTNGLTRLRYGSVRDLVLGVRATLPSGDSIHVGGKTVKNVAGLDLTRLLIGSYGTLGVITEVTFRLLPLPARRAALRFDVAQADAFDLATAILDSVLLPTHLTVSGEGSSCCLVVGLDGSSETVDRQLQDIRAMAARAGAGSEQIVTGEALQSLQREIRDFAAAPAALVATCNVPLSATPLLIADIEKSAAMEQVDVRYVADAGIGTVVVLADSECQPSLVRLYSTLVETSDQRGGHCVLDRATPDIKRQAQVWGTRRDDWKLSAAVKQRLDPLGTLNPGRFVDGI